MLGADSGFALKREHGINLLPGAMTVNSSPPFQFRRLSVELCRSRLAKGGTLRTGRNNWAVFQVADPTMRLLLPSGECAVGFTHAALAGAKPPRLLQQPLDITEDI
jgi:hypothetical protein